MGKIVELSVAQKTEVLKRIDDRLNGKLGLNLKFSDGLKSFSNDLQAIEVDLSINESDGKLVGTRYSQTVTQNGKSVELQYTEVKDVWLYQLNKLENSQQVVTQELKRFKDSKDYQSILDFLKTGGYALAPDSQKVLNMEQFSFDEKSQKSTNNFIRTLALDVIEKEEVVGVLVFNESPLIKFYDKEEVVVFNEGEQDIVPLASKGKWKKCMGNCIGCGSWEACVGWAGCLANCAACANPISCIVCIGCAAAKSSCLWKCRMCVPNSARPKECPV